MNYQRLKSVQVGNSCCHDPSNIKQYIPGAGIENAKFQKVITSAIEKVSGYANNRSLFPFLNHIRSRQQRTERAEACSLVLSVLINSMDIETRRVVWIRNGEVTGLTMSDIASRAGIGLTRCERAMRDLKSQRLVTVAKRSEKQDDGSYKGFAAIRTITKRVFEFIGLSGALEKAYQWKKSQRNKKEFKKSKAGRAAAIGRTYGEQAKAGIITGVEAMRAALTGQPPPKPSSCR